MTPPCRSYGDTGCTSNGCVVGDVGSCRETPLLHGAIEPMCPPSIRSALLGRWGVPASHLSGPLSILPGRASPGDRNRVSARPGRGQCLAPGSFVSLAFWSFPPSGRGCGTIQVETPRRGSTTNWSRSQNPRIIPNPRGPWSQSIIGHPPMHRLPFSAVPWLPRQPRAQLGSRRQSPKRPQGPSLRRTRSRHHYRI
jgi:hypothetical protein